MKDLKVHENQVRLVFEGPTRGLLGYRNQFVLDTKGEGIMSSRVVGFQPYAARSRSEQVGSMISMTSGKALGYSPCGTCRSAASCTSIRRPKSTKAWSSATLPRARR